MKKNKRKRRQYEFEVFIKDQYGQERTLDYEIWLTHKDDVLPYGTFLDWMEHGIMVSEFGRTVFIPGHLLQKTIVHFEERKNAKGRESKHRDVVNGSS